MFRIFYLFTFLLLSATIFANDSIDKLSMTGKVIDSLTKQPIPYVTVSVSQNNTIIDGVITNEKGEFLGQEKISLTNLTDRI